MPKLLMKPLLLPLPLPTRCTFKLNSIYSLFLKRNESEFCAVLGLCEFGSAAAQRCVENDCLFVNDYRKSHTKKIITQQRKLN